MSDSRIELSPLAEAPVTDAETSGAASVAAANHSLARTGQRHLAQFIPKFSEGIDETGSSLQRCELYEVNLPAFHGKVLSPEGALGLYSGVDGRGGRLKMLNSPAGHIGHSIPIDDGLFLRPVANNPNAAQRLQPLLTQQQLDHGAVLRLTFADEVHADIAAFVEAAERANRLWCDAHLYLSSGTHSGSGMHTDTKAVLMVQVAGEKHWKVCRPDGDDSIDDSIEAPGDVVFDGALRPGQALLVPRGWWHLGVPTGGESLHLSLGLSRLVAADWQNLSGADAAAAARSTPVEPRRWPAEMHDVVAGFQATMVPRFGATLHRATPHRATPPTAGSQSRFRSRVTGGIHMVADNEPDAERRISLAVSGWRLDLPVAALDLVLAILSGPEQTLAELTAVSPWDTSDAEPATTALIGYLAAAGLVATCD